MLYYFTSGLKQGLHHRICFPLFCVFHWFVQGFDDTAWGPDGVDVEASCYGHSRDDKLIWKNLFDESDYYYTNGELFDIFDPTPENAEDYQLT